MLRFALLRRCAPLLLLCACTTTPPIKAPDKKVQTTKVAAAAEAPDVVALKLTAGQSLVPAGADNTLLARIRVDVKAVPRQRRPPVNLVLAMDTSSSMNGAMDDARTAVRALLEALRDGDRLSIVSFGSEAKQILEPTLLDKKSRAAIEKRIATIESHGSTNMAAGLSTALNAAQAHLDSQAINRIVLIGDGVPNDPSQLVPLAKQAGQNGISVTALGLGLDYDETLMAQLAQHSGGRFHFVKEPEKVAKMMEEEVLRLEQVVARQTRLVLSPGPGVSIVDVIGLPGQSAGGRSQAVTVGDLIEGKSRDVVVKLKLPRRGDGSTIEVLDAEVHYQDAVAGAGSVKRRGFLAVQASADGEAVRQSRDAGVEAIGARLSVAASVIDAIAIARRGQLPRAQATLKAARRLAMFALEQGGHDPKMTAAIERIDKLAPTLASLYQHQPQPSYAQPGRPHPVQVPGSVAPQAAPRPQAAPSQPAMEMREAHDAAMQDIQGI